MVQLKSLSVCNVRSPLATNLIYSVPKNIVISYLITIPITEIPLFLRQINSKAWLGMSQLLCFFWYRMFSFPVNSNLLSKSETFYPSFFSSEKLTISASTSKISKADVSIITHRAIQPRLFRSNLYCRRRENFQPDYILRWIYH